MSYTHEQVDALARVGEAIQAEGTLTPRGKGGWMLSEWVVVTCWVNPETGEAQLVRMAAPHMLKHHCTGLLCEASDPGWKEGVE